MSRMFDDQPKKQVSFSKETVAEIEQAVRFWARSLGFGCFYESIPTRFQKIGSLFETPETCSERPNYLIEQGLAEAAVASLFFQNKVLQHDGIISDDRVMQGFVLDSNGFFEGANFCVRASAHDIKHFPFLRDSNQYTCSRFFENRDQVNWFEALDSNTHFWKKSVLAFLSILLTPNDAIYAVFDRFVTDKEAMVMVAGHYARRKTSFLSTLNASERFCAVCETLSQAELGVVIGNMSSEYDASKIIYLLQIDVRSRAAKQAEKIFEQLEELIEACTGDWVLRGVHQESVRLYTPLIGFRDALHKIAVTFFHAELTDAVLITFFRELIFLLRAVESLPLAVSADTNIALNAILSGLKSILAQLQACFFQSLDITASHFLQSTSYSFRMKKPVPEELSKHIVLWIEAQSERTQRLKNKSIIIRIFENLYGTYERAQTTYVSQASAVVLNATSWAASFLSRRPIVQALPPPHDFSDIRASFQSAEEPKALFLTIARLFSLHERDIDDVHNQFVVELMKQYQREYISSALLCAACENPDVVREFVREQRDGVTDAQLKVVAKKFIEAMQPVLLAYSSDPDGWFSVDHMEVSLHSGRFAPDPNQSHARFVQSQASIPTDMFLGESDSSDIFEGGGEFRPVTSPL